MSATWSRTARDRRTRDLYGAAATGDWNAGAAGASPARRAARAARPRGFGFGAGAGTGVGFAR